MKDFEFEDWGVLFIEGAEPEEFWIAFRNLNAPQGKPFMRTIDGLSESDLRGELGKMGIEPGRTEFLIQQARANPTK